MLYFFFISGMLGFLMNFKYFLINLLSIEYMMLFLAASLFFIFNKFNNDFFFIMMFVTFMVTEGVLGLSILICLVRNFGNNNLLSLFFCKGV